MDAVEELAGAAMHRCKVCGKGFQCGRSLGGHMRSHISLGEVVAQVGADDELKRVSMNGGRISNGVVGYGLRENTKKTLRLSDFADEEEEDGGGDGEHKACRECGKLFSSWRSLFGHMHCHASGARDHDDEDVDVDEEFFAEEAEAEVEEMVEPTAPAAVTVLAAQPRRRRRSMRVAAPVPAPPPVLAGFEKEQEDVAFCLLMLSRDTSLWSSPAKDESLEEEEPKKTTAKQVYLPRNGYAYNSDDGSAMLQYGNAKIKNGGDVDVGKSKKRRTSYYTPNSSSPKKRTRYECPGCGKVFSSYQALGGHRASHKRINTSCSAPKVAAAAAAPAPEPSVETYSSFSTLSPSASPDSVAVGIGSKKSAAAAVGKFECPVCFRVFASGQALGGHKRSHVKAGASSDDGEIYGSARGNAEQEEKHPVVVAGFLDLNFPPAPSEEA